MGALTILLALALSIGSLATEERESQGGSAPVPVEVWTGGDDGLTQRFAVAVEEEFRTSQHFVLVNHGSTGGALKVVVPGHVGWRDFGSRTRVTYGLELERQGRRTKLRGGACWESDMQRCARQIVRSVERHR